MENNLLFKLLLILKLQFFSEARQLTLELHSNAEEKGLVCNDGSPGGYYADLTENANVWLFFQRGGGWCYDEISCIERIINNIGVVGSTELVSSNQWPTERNIGGLFDVLQNANLVFIPYCSSDAHMADTQQEIFGRTVYFRGRRLAFETVTSLIGNKPNQTVIFGGLSAGGRGSMVTIDSLKKLLPESTMLYGLHDSGNYVNLNPLTSYYDPFMVQCERAYSLFNEPEVNLKCQEMYPNDTWKCLCGQYMLPLVETPSQVIIHQYDSYQLSQNIGSLPRLWTYDACKYANSQFRPLMKETIGQLMFTNEHVVFAPACYHHGLVQSKSFYDIKINGMSAWDQLEIFMNSQGADREHLVSNCEQVNCQETCPEIETGPNTFCQVF